MFDRTVEPDPRTAAPPSRNRYRMRDGHRREYAASRDRGSTSFPERCARGLADIGVYGAVSYRDLAEARFGGHPYTTRRAVNAWVREGLVTETTATGPKGNPFKVLTLTRSGVAEARKRAAERGMDPSQEIRFARTRPAQAAHDTAVYRACMKEKQRLLDRGAAVRRIRLDTELKSAVARGSEAARLKDGKRAADAERHRTAGELGLPLDDEGHVLYPDAQIEYTDSEGRTGRVNIEVASGNYREGAIKAKAAAGFALHANGPAAAHLLRTLGLGSRRRPLLAAGTRRPRSGRSRTLTTGEARHATLENQRRPHRRHRRFGHPARRAAPRIPRAVLAAPPRRTRRLARPAPGARTRSRRGRHLRRRTRRRARRPRAARRSRRALRSARRGGPGPHRRAPQRRRGRLGMRAERGPTHRCPGEIHCKCGAAGIVLAVQGRRLPDT